MTESKPRKRRWPKVLIGIPVALLLIAGGRYLWWTEFEHRLITVVPGELEQSAEFEPDDLVALARERGYRSVIDLRDTRDEVVAAECDALREAGIEHFHLPMTQEPPREQIDAFLQFAGQPEHQPALVHCEHGEGRSVLMAALYRIQFEGMTNEAAWRAASRLPPELKFVEKAWPGLISFRPESPKGKILLEFEPRQD